VRAVRCWCEELIVADDDEALLPALREHVAEKHPDEERSEDDLRAHVEAKAYDPPDRPPWAY
jgi:predicted small metal-binding protein